MAKSDHPASGRIWHYCCSHSVRKIIRTDELRPNLIGYQPEAIRIAGMRVEAMPVVWLTDLDVRTDEDGLLLGLGTNDSGYVTCDRLAYRFRVSPRSVEPWAQWADRAVETGTLTAHYRSLLELDREPERWYVSGAPIKSPRLDERYRRP